MKKYYLSWLLIFAVIGNACGEDSEEAGQPKINVDVSEIIFADFKLDVLQTIPVVISNVGDTDLQISQIKLSESTLSDSGQEITRGEKWSENTTIAAGDKLTIEVTYLPQDIDLDEGELVIENNSSTPNFTVPIRSERALGPEILIDSALDLGIVPMGETADKIIVLQNIGTEDLSLEDISLPGVGFSTSFPISEGGDITDDRSIPKALVKRDEKIFIRVKYEATSDEPAEAKLKIESNVEEPVLVDVTANVGPCLRVLPDDKSIAFGDRLIGKKHELGLTIENCSRVSDLRINELQICNVDGEQCIEGAFAWKDSPGAFGSLEGGVIKPRANVVLGVNFDPVEGESLGKIRFGSDDSRYSNFEVDLSGTGLVEKCPTASARNVGDSNYHQTEFSSSLSEAVELSAQSILTPGNVVDYARYEWTLVAKPPTSTVDLIDRTQANAKLFPDAFGEYVVELRVFDEQNVEECEPSRIVVQGTYSNEGIIVALTWDTPADPDQLDNLGSDLDLHYLHPDGVWNAAPYDIFFNNKTANWGATTVLDDPSMDIDDINGSGPEVVSHQPSDESLLYSVGVFYYDDETFGPSYATIQIFIDGTLSFEKEDQLLEGVGAFWHVATISWPAKTVSAVDRIRVGF